MAPNPNTSDARASTLSMNLLIDTKSQSVLYAEACKDVVDFLFSFLTLPVGTVIKILSKGSTVGSVGNLYGSVEELDETYVRSSRAKQALLAPTGGKLQLPPEAPAAQQPPCTKVFRCKHCDGRMAVPVNLVDDDDDEAPTAMAALSEAGAGFVKGNMMYTVTDDLKVAPMSTISGITLLHTLGVWNVRMVEQKTVQLGYDEGLEILRVSLQSKTVLTDVFIEKKRKA